jgi:hypothetical protein
VSMPEPAGWFSMGGPDGPCTGNIGELIWRFLPENV